jgi:hypothetical protein
MLLILLVILIFIIFCALADSASHNSRGRANQNSPKYIVRRPAQVYYPNHKKKVESVSPQVTTSAPAAESQKAHDSESGVIEPISDLPRAPRINEFRRPRRAVHIKDIANSKFNYAPERKQIERTPISEHDERVYREAERLRIQRENRITEERNRRWFAQKEFERYHKQ